MTRIRREKIELTLSPQGKGLMLERRVIESDGSIVTHALPVFSENDLATFIACDVFYRDLANCYASISRNVREFFAT